MRRLKVWVATPELHRRGGTERCLAEQMERWRERFDLRLYTMRVQDVDLRGTVVRRIPRLPGPHLFRYVWWFVANTLVRAWDAGRLGRPDVVHSTGINSADASVMSVHIVFAKYWRRVRSRIMRDLLTPHLTLRTMHRVVFWSLIRALERFIYGGPASIWAISREDASELEARFGRPEGSVRTLPHGVDGRRFSPEARLRTRPTARETLGVSQRRVMLLVGNDAHKKGVNTAVRVLTLLPGDVVLAVGGRVDAELVRAWARSEGVESRVLLWPHTPDVLNYYAAAEMFVAPSREDAFHQPALEALACGLPAVVSASAGASELLEDGRHALILHDPEDAVECARLVQRILGDPALAEHLAHEGRALAEGCSWDSNAERAADLIEREATTPRVLVLAPHLWGTGGIERAARTLVSALGDLYGPERVGVLSVWGGSGSLPCRTLWRGPEGEGAVPVSVWTKVRFTAAALAAARRWRHRLVIVACHPHLSPVARVCSLISGAPYLVWCHGEEVWRRQRALVRSALRSADAVMAPSSFTASMAQRTAGLQAKRPAVIPHPLPPEITFPQVQGQRGQAKVLSVARLVAEHRYKGVDTLIASWPRVLQSVPEAELLIVGDGSDRARLETDAARLGLNGQVRFAGKLDDSALSKAYAEAAVFALPVRTTVGNGSGGEGFGLVFLEAAAAGLPVVAGDGGAIPEVVRDGETGFLIDPAAPDAVADAIVRLLRDPALATKMGEAARRRAFEEFSYDAFRTRIGDLIGQVRQDL